VSVTAQGGTVPAFGLPSAAGAAPKFPLVLLLSQPLAPVPTSGSATSVTVGRDQDLALVWSRGAPNVHLFVQGGGTSGGDVLSLTCDFDSGGGQATISRDILAALPSQTSLQLYTVGSYFATAGAWDVAVRIATDVATPDKKAGVTIIVP